MAVWIGVVTQNTAHEAYTTPAEKAGDPGEADVQARAMADELNAHGGILHRKVRLRFYNAEVAKTSQDPATAGEAACTYFTQDTHVVAVWNVSTELDQVAGFRECLAKRKVLLFTAALRAVTDAELHRLAPYYLHTLMVSWEELGPVLAQRLKAQGWLHGWDSTTGQPAAANTKIGILSDNTPPGKRAAAVLTKAFADLGYPGALTFQYSDASQGQAASVQYFKANRVTHVIVTDVELTAFQYYAATQIYYPRIGMTSYNLPYGNLQASGFTPPKANNGAMGVGWASLLDVDAAHAPAPGSNARHCLAVMKKVDQAPADGRTKQLFALSGCDTFSLIARGAQDAGGFAAAGIYASIMRTSESFSPANGFAAALSAAKPFLQGMVRDLSWNSSCSCMEYGAATIRL